MKHFIFLLLITAVACSKSKSDTFVSNKVKQSVTMKITERCISSHIETTTVFPKQGNVVKPETVTRVICDASVVDTIYVPLKLN